jgi:hypothetical protein
VARFSESAFIAHKGPYSTVFQEKGHDFLDSPYNI